MCVCVCVCVCVCEGKYIDRSSSSCCTASKNFPDSLLLFVPIIHPLRQVF